MISVGVLEGGGLSVQKRGVSPLTKASLLLNKIWMFCVCKGHINWTNTWTNQKGKPLATKSIQAHEPDLKILCKRCFSAGNERNIGKGWAELCCGRESTRRSTGDTSERSPQGEELCLPHKQTLVKQHVFHTHSSLKPLCARDVFKVNLILLV